MPVTAEFRFDPGQILEPALPSNLTRKEPAAFGASLTIAAGQAMAQKTSDAKLYPLNLIATDGTQTFKGFSEYPLATDASGNVFFVFGGTSAGTSYYGPPQSYSDIYTGGIFNPLKVTTAATGTVTAEVDTLTPANPATGDIFSVNAPGIGAIEVTVGATQTATATVALLANAWNANPALKALATTSGTATFILTAATKGPPLNLTVGVYATSTATFALAITTPAVAALTSEVDTFTPANVSTGAVYTITINYPNGSTYAVSATVGLTQTATAITTLLKTAWNNDPTASAYAAATGTATFILTSLPSGNGMNVTAAVVTTGSDTIAKAVTTPAYGRNISDILPGCPGARVLSSGYWELP